MCKTGKTATELLQTAWDQKGVCTQEWTADEARAVEVFLKPARAALKLLDDDVKRKRDELVDAHGADAVGKRFKWARALWQVHAGRKTTTWKRAAECAISLLSVAQRKAVRGTIEGEFTKQGYVAKRVAP